MNKVMGDGKGIDPYRVNVGIEYRTIRATVPLIEFTATPERLEFRARFGLGILVGPWRFDREQVTEFFTTPGWFSNRVNIRGNQFEMQVFSFSPEPLLLTLEELGYPVDWIVRT